MGILRNKFRNFMQGRYGMDEFSKALVIAACVCAALSLFLGRIFYVLAVAALGYVYFRMFSMNYEKRYKENRAYFDWKNRIGAFFRKQKSMMQQRKTHHIYTCPQCRQKIRIPKGRGKIIVTCPKCKMEFQKRS